MQTVWLLARGSPLTPGNIFPLTLTVRPFVRRFPYSVFQLCPSHTFPRGLSYTKNELTKVFSKLIPDGKLLEGGDIHHRLRTQHGEYAIYHTSVCTRE